MILSTLCTFNKHKQKRKLVDFVVVIQFNGTYTVQSSTTEGTVVEQPQNWGNRHCKTHQGQDYKISEYTMEEMDNHKGGWIVGGGGSTNCSTFLASATKLVTKYTYV